MTQSDLWNRAADAMRSDDDARWHAVAEWMRSEVNVRNTMEPFAELMNCAIEQTSGIRGYLRFGRHPDGQPALDLDTSEGATAVALAYLGEATEPEPEPTS